MLRILHTADWHLGQCFHNFDRDHEHGAFLEWLLATLCERHPDVLLVSGDVFDSVNPSATAQRRLYQFLARAQVALPKLQIVLTAGNHDAAARLEAPAHLLQTLQIHVVGTVSRDQQGEIVWDKFLLPLRDSTGEVKALALVVPFLRPSDVPLLPDEPDPYLDGIRAFYQQLTARARERCQQEWPGAALIALGHCHMQSATESRDSERRLVVGGTEALRADTFPADLAYVALGHLHKAQSFEEGRIQYCGSPIPLSFSERDYHHSVLEVDLDGTQRTVTALPVPKTAFLLRLPESGAAPLEEVLPMIEQLPLNPGSPAETHPFLEVHLLNNGPDLTRRRKLEKALEGRPVRLASIKLTTPAQARTAQPALPDLQRLDPEELMLNAFRKKYATEPDASLLAALREILNAELPSPETTP